MSRTVIPQADCPAERVETGALRFGDDWTGTFFRGDASLFAYMQLTQMADQERPIDALQRTWLRSLAGIFAESDERKFPR